MVSRPPFLLLPRVDRLWLVRREGADGAWLQPAHHNALTDFVRSSEPWTAERILLPPRLRRILWALLPVQLVWGIWLGLIAAGATSCDGPTCTVATLDHPAALLVCAALCFTGLAGLAPLTRGFSQVNTKEVTGLIVSAAAGAIALLGIAALVLLVLIIALVVAAFIAAFTLTP